MRRQRQPRPGLGRRVRAGPRRAFVDASQACKRWGVRGVRATAGLARVRVTGRAKSPAPAPSASAGYPCRAGWPRTGQPAVVGAALVLDLGQVVADDAVASREDRAVGPDLVEPRPDRRRRRVLHDARDRTRRAATRSGGASTSQAVDRAPRATRPPPPRWPRRPSAAGWSGSTSGTTRCPPSRCRSSDGCS